MPLEKNMILNSNVDGSNYTQFSGCRLKSNGKEVEFNYPSGDSYVVSIEYFCKMYDNIPHYIKQKGKVRSRWIEWDPYKHAFVKLRPKELRFTRCRRSRDHFAVYIYLSNDTAFEVPWDTVLMMCEPRYEWFGGHTERSMDIIFKYHGLSKEETEIRKVRTLKKR